jgi:hypothetical protein
MLPAHTAYNSATFRQLLITYVSPGSAHIFATESFVASRLPQPTSCPPFLYTDNIA